MAGILVDACIVRYPIGQELQLQRQVVVGFISHRQCLEHQAGFEQNVFFDKEMQASAVAFACSHPANFIRLRINPPCG
jgi:hypothetical protein